MIVYFSSVTENTKRFVDKLELPATRIPLFWNVDEPLIVDNEYIIIIPSYGGGSTKSAVPKQVIKFLNIKENRDLCRGIIASGNINFGEGYLIAGKILSNKLQVPFYYGFELMGNEEDVAKVKHHIPKILEEK